MPFLLFSLTFLQRKQTNEKPSLAQSPEILLRANIDVAVIDNKE